MVDWAYVNGGCGSDYNDDSYMAPRPMDQTPSPQAYPYKGHGGGLPDTDVEPDPFTWQDANRAVLERPPDAPRGPVVAPTCDACGCKMRIRDGRYGLFWYCPESKPTNSHPTKNFK